MLTRAYRLVSASADAALEAAERFSGDALVREAIRDMDHAIDALKRERRAATERLASIEQDRATSHERLATLTEQARYALDRDRPDLAERAVAARIDVEAGITAFDRRQAETEAARAQAEAALADASARRVRMDLPSAAPESSAPALDARVARAQAGFERAQTLAAARHAELPGLGEIEALRREERIAADMGALRAERRKPAPRAS
ncbi:MAG: PspA/IM30 family protein [Candidatus Sphingomonas colombiensis]|nr:PspA/IM30 family protein [Sphingomonas sp.]WEK44912.1 MAG: PspA/IM30 family protein [Sphingomonas sp.]